MTSYKNSMLIVLLILLSILFTPIVFCEGEIFQGEDGKYYQIIDGVKYEVDYGSGSDGSVSDLFKGYSETTKPDADTMQQVNENIVSPIGTAISFIIYLIFAFTAFTTVTDLAYIALPPIRPFLYNPNGKDSVSNLNAYRMTAAGQNAAQWQNMANNSAASAQQHMANAKMAASQGDFITANSQMRMANSDQESANRRQGYANSWAREQARNDANFVSETQDRVNRAHKNNMQN